MPSNNDIATPAFGITSTMPWRRIYLNIQNNVIETLLVMVSPPIIYGKYDLFDGEKCLRYHVPAGEYTVKCNIRGGFETIELHKENGWDTPTTIEQIMMSAGDEKDIVIEE